MRETIIPYIPRPKVKPSLYLCGRCGMKTYDPSKVCGPCHAEERAGMTWEQMRKEVLDFSQ